MIETKREQTPERAAILFQSESLLEQARECKGKQRYELAEALYKEALDKRLSVLGQDDPSIANVIFELGLLYESIGREEEAINLYEQAVSILEKAFYPGHGKLAPILEHQADCYIRLGKLLEAEPILKRAVEINEKTLSAEHRQTLESAHKLARLCQKLGKLTEAETILTKALKQLDTPLGPAEEFHYDLALVYAGQGKMMEAEKAFKEAIEGFKSRGNYGGLVKCLEGYAELLKTQNRKTDLEEVEAAAKRMRAAKYMGQRDVFPATLLRA